MSVPATSCHAQVAPPLAAGLLWICAAGLACGQESIRSSLAGEEAASSRVDSGVISRGIVRTGPLSLSADVSLEAEFNDNINLADSSGSVKAESDFILRPRLNIHSNLFLTPRNNLALDVGMGTDRYLRHPERSSSTISLSPGSQLSFNLYVGDFRFSFYDRFSLQQNPISQATLSNTSNYGIFRNAAGATWLWDLNKVILAAGYERKHSISTVEEYEFSDHSQDVLFASVTFPVASNFFAGVRATHVSTDYRIDIRPDVKGFSLGGFIEGQLTAYTRMSVFGGYRAYDFNSTFPFTLEQTLRRDSSSDEDGAPFFIVFGITNRLNAFVTQSLHARTETRLGFAAPLEDYTDIRYGVQWRLNDSVSLSLQAFYEHLAEKGTVANEELDRIGGIFSIVFKVTSRTSAALYYTCIRKDSNLPLQDYHQNVYGIELRHTF